MRILADASLPGLKSHFPAPFILSTYANLDELEFLIKDQDILFCRSTLKVNAALLKDTHLKYVATASSGTDHLDHNFLNSHNIISVDAKGSNATAVADYVVSCLAWLEMKKLIKGQKAAVIGMGEVGLRVSQRLEAADYEVAHYDPPKALINPNFKSCDISKLYEADILCIHAELHNTPPYPSLNFINEQFLAQLKPDCVLINASRGGVVHEEALLKCTNKISYCTDVYLKEHSIEAKLAAVSMVSDKLHRLLNLTLPITVFNPNCPQLKYTSQSDSWQDNVLSWYNPADETHNLQHAPDKQSAFLELRKNHNKRHDFSLYCEGILDKKIRLLLGKF